MNKPKLEIVGHIPAQVVGPRVNKALPLATIAEQIKTLQDEAKVLAVEHVDEMIRTIETGLTMAQAVMDCGDAFPPGVKSIAMKLIRDGEDAILGLRSLRGRQLGTRP